MSIRVVSTDERLALKNLRCERAKKDTQSRARAAKLNYETTQLNVAAAQRQREAFAAARNKYKALLIMISEFTHPLHRFICCYINEREVPCKNPGFRRIDGFEHDLPYEPKFCARHANLLDEQPSKYENCRDKLAIIAEFAKNVSAIPTIESDDGDDSDDDDETVPMLPDGSGPAMLPAPNVDQPTASTFRIMPSPVHVAPRGFPTQQPLMLPAPSGPTVEELDSDYDSTAEMPDVN